MLERNIPNIQSTPGTPDGRPYGGRLATTLKVVVPTILLGAAAAAEASCADTITPNVEAGQDTHLTVTPGTETKQNILKIPGVTVNKPSAEIQATEEASATNSAVLATRINKFLEGQDDHWNADGVTPSINYFEDGKSNAKPLPLSEASKAFFVEANAVPLGVYYDKTDQTQVIVFGLVTRDAHGNVNGRFLQAIAPFQGGDATAVEVTYKDVNGQDVTSQPAYPAVRASTWLMGENKVDAILSTSAIVPAVHIGELINSLYNDHQIVQLSYNPTASPHTLSADQLQRMFETAARVDAQLDPNQQTLPTVIPALFVNKANLNIDHNMTQMIDQLGQDPGSATQANGLFPHVSSVTAQDLSTLFDGKSQTLPSSMQLRLPAKVSSKVVVGVYN